MKSVRVSSGCDMKSRLNAQERACLPGGVACEENGEEEPSRPSIRTRSQLFDSIDSLEGNITPAITTS